MEGFLEKDIFLSIIGLSKKEVHTGGLITEPVVFALFHGFNSRQQIPNLHCLSKWVWDRTSKWLIENHICN